MSNKKENINIRGLNSKEYPFLKELFDKFKNDEIKIEISHRTNTGYHFKNDDLNDKFELFIKLFYLDLIECEELNYREMSSKGLMNCFDTRCFECGEYIKFIFKDDTLRDVILDDCTDTYVSTRCERIEGCEFEIEFPTGEILCNDSIPPILELFDSFYGDINITNGIKETILNFAEKNISHVFVGNTCPSLYWKDNKMAIENAWTNEGRYCICGHDRGDDYWNNSHCECGFIEVKSIEDSKNISNICTDLWWVTIMDKKIYKEILYKSLEDNVDFYTEEEIQEKREEIEYYLKETLVTEQKIKPGVYKCHYNMLAREQEDENYNLCKPTTYLTFEWISDIKKEA